MARIGRALRRYARDAVVALRVAPIEVALGIAVAVSWSLFVEAGDVAFTDWLELAALAGLAGGFAWAATLLRGLGVLQDRARWLLAAAGLALVALYDATLLDFDRTAEGWRAALLLAAVWLGVSLVPLAADGDRDRTFRRVNLRFVTRVVGVVLYTAGLFVGVALALAAVDSLFELDMEGRIYGHVFGALAFGLAPWLVAGGAPAIATSAPPGDAARIVRRFAVFLVLPLLLLYDGILYAYGVRIALLQELPRNLVSPLVLVAGLIATAAVILFAGGTGPRPAARDEEDRTGPPGETAPDVPWPVRLAAPLFLPLGVLGVWAVAVRVQQYGFTEFRYVRLGLLGALLFLAGLATLARLRHHRLRAWPIPATLAVAALLAALGPWSATATARHSQQARLAELLRETGFETLPARPADVARPVAAETWDEIRNLGRYLTTHHGTGALSPLVALDPAPGRFTDLPRRLGLEPRTLAGGPLTVTGRLRRGVPTARLGSGVAHPLSVPPDRSGEEPAIRADWLPDGTTLRVTGESATATADLGPLVRYLLTGGAEDRTRPGRTRAAPGGPFRTLGPDRALVALRNADGTAVGRLLVWDVVVDRRAPEAEDTVPATERAESDEPVVRVTRLEGLVVW